jgi:outer membrane protein assembly factor BamB
LISSGYNAGAALVSITPGKATLVWRNKNLRAHINSPVVWGDSIFGIDGNTGGGNLVCLNAQTGDKLWEEKSVKGGALIAASGLLIVVSEKGDLVVAEASPERFRQLHRQPVLKNRTWAQPVLANGRLYLRDNVGTLVCLTP